mgnify:CR=1 FL=1
MKNQAILTPVREAHLFDEKALSDYLIANLQGFKTCLLYTSDAADEVSPV